jgi:hypothetical protein
MFGRAPEFGCAGGLQWEVSAFTAAGEANWSLDPAAAALPDSALAS